MQIKHSLTSHGHTSRHYPDPLCLVPHLTLDYNGTRSKSEQQAWLPNTSSQHQPRTQQQSGCGLARLRLGPGLVLGARSWRLVDHGAPVMVPVLVCLASWGWGEGV
ncbi:hypothetical protein PoB_007497500 [Plakobranchus ocellatus]|uniref:Uncharacterized protein n=1 Tax=Plakobranchus ocellatus TaxID=259542 RepID=A0AAV4DWS4_9GAST|nr:hypothetical protein PoB_007497500 [Plakobranchus ocellatus]